MSSFVEQLKLILLTYCERSRSILVLLKSPNLDDSALSAAIRMQQAAFHNFVSLESRSARDGFKLLDHSDLAELGREATKLSKEVESTLNDVLNKTAEVLQSVARGRKNVSAYHSGTPIYHRFIKSV